MNPCITTWMSCLGREGPGTTANSAEGAVSFGHAGRSADHRLTRSLPDKDDLLPGVLPTPLRARLGGWDDCVCAQAPVLILPLVCDPLASRHYGSWPRSPHPVRNQLSCWLHLQSDEGPVSRLGSINRSLYQSCSVSTFARTSAIPAVRAGCHLSNSAGKPAIALIPVMGRSLAFL